MNGDIVLVGHTEDGSTVVFMFYSHPLGKMVVITCHGDAESGAYDEDMTRHFESDSRAKAENRAMEICHQFDIPYMDEMIMTITEFPLDEKELKTWVNPAPPYLN